MTDGLVISFSGRIASGKTHITQSLATALAWPRASFGDYLRSVMANNGIADPTREALQDLGQSLIASDPDKFCRDVLAQAAFMPGGNLLLDGIRHVDIHRRIAGLVKPSRAILFYLAAADEVVAQRVRLRGASENEFRRADQHQVEQELRKLLPQYADCIINAGAPAETVLTCCLSAIEECGADPNVIARARAVVRRLPG